ncbi:GNAT family N-acetyltransferase [Mycolicibacter sp. MYC123]|uniref:GNAT family N-acetyltransferase n=1 Tax=[Mycobacterium] zoologicum TaxID=2872311 RepID=A0ABU5YKJ7_9MYCO|nr:GNAT family N-acetyltransferase [Mycolicibacter sp. MYC123]MEB3049989.1 GNAT family N-acetyltransferase [Mycolicibacter sp. MYC123]
MAQPPELPEVGVRVSLRYLRPPGSEPPMGDVIGHLVEAGPRVRVRSADGTVHEFRQTDVLYVRRLTDRPVKNSAIRSVEHAAALAWPGSEHQWLDGWFLRAAPGADLAANSAVPLDMFAHTNTIPAIIDWYAQRDVPPILAVPERLLRLPEDLPAVHQTRTLVRDLAVETTPPTVTLTVLADSEVAFAWIAGVAFGRGAVTEGPDGTRWLGVACLRVAEGSRGQGHGRAICAALQAWGADRGATRGYAQSGTEAFGFFEAIGFAGQHRTRYLDARTI